MCVFYIYQRRGKISKDKIGPKVSKVKLKDALAEVAETCSAWRVVGEMSKKKRVTKKKKKGNDSEKERKRG
jgi:hypothetical protein